VIKQYKAVVSSTVIQFLSANFDERKTKPIIVMMHGFPECSWAWEAYLIALQKDYCVIAPDLPGYNFSIGFENHKNYQIGNLIKTFSEFFTYLLTQSTQQKIHLIAHDWGGAIAWPLAAFHAELLQSLTIINAAHPSTFTREMQNNPSQQQKSEYINDLISEDAVANMKRNNFSMFTSLFTNTKTVLTSQQKQKYSEQWMDDSNLANMAAYYQHMPQLKTQSTKVTTNLRIPNIHIRLPTLVLWGEQDSAFVEENLDGLEQWVNDLRIVRFKDDGHWVAHHQLQAITQSIKAFLTPNLSP